MIFNVMAGLDSPEFQCPQFVDFLCGVDDTPKDDVFFDCEENTPGKIKSISALKTPNVQDTKEEKLLNRMCAAAAVIRRTPGLKKAVNAKRIQSSNVCDSKLHSLSKQRDTCSTSGLSVPPIYRSRSIPVVEKLAINQDKTKNKELGTRKRSSSLNDLRPAASKKQTYPMTPMCLKRTQTKSKPKVKTTEEMQLEEIAKLQKQTKQHLRYNQISLKKLGLKARDHAAENNNQPKVENHPRTFKKAQREVKPVDKTNAVAKDIRPDNQKNTAVSRTGTFQNATFSSRMHAVKAANLPKLEAAKFQKPAHSLKSIEEKMSKMGASTESQNAPKIIAAAASNLPDTEVKESSVAQSPSASSTKKTQLIPDNLHKQSIAHMQKPVTEVKELPATNKINAPSTSATGSTADLSEKYKAPAFRKSVNQSAKLGLLHSGVLFHGNSKKLCVTKAFDTTCRRKDTAYDRKCMFDVPINQLLKNDRNKENIPVIKVQPFNAKSIDNGKNARPSSFQPVSLAKKSVTSVSTPVQGLSFVDDNIRKK